jgi:hypothetical protein
VSSKKAITLRQCFTHTTGLYGHEEYGGLHNPWLENVIANGLDYLEPGIDEPICMVDVADGNAIYYYHYDGLGSVAAISDGTGDIVV